MVQMHLSSSQPPLLPLLCPNAAPLVQTQSRSKQCMTTLHNVTSANTTTLALQHPTLAYPLHPFALKSGGKYTSVIICFIPFQHWICIESASVTFTKRMPRSTTRPCRMTFALRTATSHFGRYILPHSLKVYPTDKYPRLITIVWWLGNTGLFPIPNLDKYHLCLFWEVARHKMWT